MNDSYAIELNNVTKQYKKSDFVLDSITCNFPRHSIVGLVGENGSGKTTLISIILNQLHRDSGEINVLGLDNIHEDYLIKRRIGVSIDECCYHPCFTPKDINGIMKYIYSNWNKKKFLNYLRQFKIDASCRIEKMSKGMKSKLVLAAALAHETDLLIFDELTSGLDPVIRDDILNTLHQYVENGNGSVLFSTHITSDLDKVADYVLFIHNGKQVLFDSVQNLHRDYTLVEIDNGDEPNFPIEKIIARNTRNKQQYLLKNCSDLIVSNHPTRAPSLEEIMMVFIKGENS